MSIHIIVKIIFRSAAIGIFSYQYEKWSLPLSLSYTLFWNVLIISFMSVILNTLMIPLLSDKCIIWSFCEFNFSLCCDCWVFPSGGLFPHMHCDLGCNLSLANKSCEHEWVSLQRSFPFASAWKHNWTWASF